jgi:hypothetical protein
MLLKRDSIPPCYKNFTGYFMSQERREKQERRSENGNAVPWKRSVLYAVVIVAAFALAYFLGYRTKQHRYDGFARCLRDHGVKMYGAWWCPHCQDQKEMFADSFEFVNYTECGVKGDVHKKSQICIDENIKAFPTWQFPPTGERVERVFSLQELSDRTGCSLP